jgi:hypothetical protein
MLNPENVRLNDGHALLQVGEPLVLALGREAPLHRKSPNIRLPIGSSNLFISF